MTITAITCTGSRPEAFELCQKYMAEQTLKVDQWIVVHDGITPEQLPELRENYPHFELYAGPRVWKEGLNTHRFNMEEALKYVKGDVVLFIEDDDYYAPTYVETMAKALKSVDAVGISNNRYYNLAMPGWREMGNFRHSSLCSTAFNRKLLPYMQQAVDSGEMYFDVKFWELIRAAKERFALTANSSLCIGIKAMPGRSGIGQGHRNSGYSIDSGIAKLLEWVGKDVAEIYRKYIAKVPPAVKAVAPLKKATLAPKAAVVSKATLPPRPSVTDMKKEVSKTAKTQVPKQSTELKQPKLNFNPNTERSGQTTVQQMNQVLPKTLGQDPIDYRPTVEKPIPTLKNDERKQDHRLPG